MLTTQKKDSFSILFRVILVILTNESFLLIVFAITFVIRNNNNNKNRWTKPWRNASRSWNKRKRGCRKNS
jgi:hypothetical protein